MYVTLILVVSHFFLSWKVLKIYLAVDWYVLEEIPEFLDTSPIKFLEAFVP